MGMSHNTVHDWQVNVTEEENCLLHNGREVKERKKS